MIKIIDDARRVAAISFSLWMQVVGAMLLVGSEALFALGITEINPYALSWTGLTLTVLGVLGRFVKQPDGAWRNWVMIVAMAVVAVMFGVVMAAAGGRAGSVAPPRPDIATLEEAMDIGMPTLIALEGMELRAYRDIVGVLTICAGITNGVRSGEVRSRSRCEADTRAEAVRYFRGWYSATTASTRRARLPAHRWAAFGSFTYNVGIGGAVKSTATKRLNAGNVTGACEALGWWNKAGGRVVRGLVKRRQCEVQLCRDGSKEKCPA